MSRGGIHSGKPWREVVHIKDCVGEHGGEYWMLTLEPCRHVVPRSKPKIHIGNLLRKSWFEKHRAPERVKCILCPDVEAGVSP